jgi:queuine tRNA-ribosyltransferase/7-cyano-7-deazaguanine tRNA-ribosyltransferase
LNLKSKTLTRKPVRVFFNTPAGKIKTPNLAIVATAGKIKLLNKTDHLRANPDLLIANTFHLFVNNKVREIKKAGGLHQWSGFKKPIMTDSGGFQVFSLGWGRVHGIGKIVKNNNQFQEVRPPVVAEGEPPEGLIKRQYLGGRTSQILNKVKISEKGVVFEYNGKKYELTPEKSIKIQQAIGPDIIFAFDECTSPLHSYTYTKKAMERTHRWATRSLKARNLKLKAQQALFGIVQSGIFEDLRKKSSRFIGSLPFDGFGIGGSFGEKQMKDILGWALSGLDEERLRHLLGIGKIKDIFIAVKQGIDLFDCVVPTREARHGVLYTKNGKLAIKKGIFSHDRKLIDKNCSCWVCRQKITRQEFHYYFKADNISVNQRTNQRQSASNGQRLATIHNIYFFKNLFREIRKAISENRLEKLEKEYYNYI